MQGGYKAAAMSGVTSAAPAPPASNGSGAPANSANAANANGAKKTNTKKKPATSDKGNGKPPGLADAPAAGRAPPPGFAKPSGTAAAPSAVPNAWASPLPAVPNAASVGFSDSQQRLLRHRALFVFRFLVGKAVEVTLVDQSHYVGILDCVDPDDFSVVLKNTQRKGDLDAAAADFDSGSTVIFKRRQLAHMAAEGVVNYTEGAPSAGAAAAPGFRTDTEISNRSHEHLFGRELESASSWLDPQLDTGDLEEPARRKGAGWNQFEANEKLFGVVSTFDENLYTTKLDKTKFSNEKSREAERLAREIERETTGNFHLQEERGQAVHGGDDLDEEAKYSSVDRKQQSSPASRGPTAYVPPALRNASLPTSAGPTKQKPISPKTQPPAKALSTAAAPPATGTTTPAVVPPTKTTTTAAAPATAVTATPAPAADTAPAPKAVSPPAEPSPATLTPAAAADAASQPRKPISFSEAVTGRPTARPSPTLAPAAAPTPASAASATKVPAKQERKASTSPKKQPSPKSEKPAKATSPPATKKEAKAAPSKTQSDKKAASEKKSAEAKSGEESKAEKKSKTTKADSSSKQAAAATATPTETAPTSDATAAPAAAAPTAKKTALNPKAKEFKLSASAATFTPKFAAPPAAPVTSSPYRQPSAAPYGHMHPPPPHPAMGGMGYPPAPEEWMYDGMMVDESEYAAAAAHAYMGYGMPMMPNPAMMQQPMYAPMMPPQQNVRMGRGGGAGYGYNQPGMYNSRGYYGQGAAPGAVPYHGAPGAVPGMPQPPLPPIPAETAGPVDTPASPSLAPSSVPPAGAAPPASNSKNAGAASKK